MYFPKPAINENDLAIIERGDTAEHSIEKGQYVSWKGKLGKAVSAILQGATLDDSLFSYDTDGVINSLNNNYYDYENMTSITLTSGTQTYTAPSNGMLVIQLGSGDGTKPYIYIKNSSNIGIVTIQSHGTWETATLPLKKGQQVSIEFTNYVSSYNAFFIPRLT